MPTLGIDVLSGKSQLTSIDAPGTPKVSTTIEGGCQSPGQLTTDESTCAPAGATPAERSSSSLSSLAVLCAACRASEPSRADAPGSAPTLQFQVFGDPAEITAYRELVAAFEQRTPDVKVGFIPVGNQRDHMAKLTTGFAGGDQPDVFLINFRRFGQFADKDVLDELGPRLSERGHLKESDLYEQSAEAFRYNGKLMCIPQNISSLVVYYNLSLIHI